MNPMEEAQALAVQRRSACLAESGGRPRRATSEPRYVAPIMAQPGAGS